MFYPAQINVILQEKRNFEISDMHIILYSYLGAVIYEKSPGIHTSR